MSRVSVAPSVAAGVIDAPPSKSYTHRALIAAHLADRPYRVLHPLDADDTRATARGTAVLGSSVEFRRREWAVHPSEHRGPRRIRCGASGTTLRLLSGVAALSDRPTTFIGTDRLSRRPLASLLATLSAHGVKVRHPPRRSLPLTIEGVLRPGRFAIRGDESSQFTSALLFALPRLSSGSRLVIEGTLVSEPYVQATLSVLRAHHVRLRNRFGDWRIAGNQTYEGRQFAVPGDASSAAYLWAAAAVSGGKVTVTGVPGEWPQADLAVLDILRAAGATVLRRGSSVTVSGRLEVPFTAELTPSPDLYPLAGALAARIPGTSRLNGAPQIVGKESDRRSATIGLVRSLGGRARFRRGSLEIEGSDRRVPAKPPVSDDHRLIMSAAVAALGASAPSVIADASAVRKSYPGFWHDLTRLGISWSRRT